MSTYLQSSEGKFIPATKRPDGTWRKARRVKDGYVPQEEVPLYESKGKQFVAQRQTGVPPGMCPIVAAEAKKEREKQERSKAKKQQQDAGPKNNPKAPTPGVLVLPQSSTCPPPPKANQPSGRSKEVNAVAKALENTLRLEEGAQEIDANKQLKKLRKKIREIELIESRIQAGEQKKLDKDQLDKVKKKSEILRQIKALESEQRSS
ncbi:partner of Y14 and mago [Drosophila serrata]|uniref:partner of Y14 and mago n=1 Tax=Drosophila serrata TaxID=7274 RepID=UPI000A1D0DE1|nr:partner of Y14 and mago [Drosophila serrata]